MKAVLDGDVLCFQASIKGDEHPPTSWGSGVETGNQDVQVTFNTVDAKITEWCRAAHCAPDDVTVVFSDLEGRNFRKEFCPWYKENRKDAKPTDYEAAVEYVRDRYRTYWLPRLEGDDVIGLLLTGPNGNKYVGVSTDKDLMTIPGTIVRLGTHDRPFKNTPIEADRYWMKQTVMGDQVDNYFGAPGAGEKAADAIVKRGESLNVMWKDVLLKYAEQFDDKRWGKKFRLDNAYDEALVNARCARILRYGDWDKETGEVKLWLP